jgi:5-(carboxyamino)imidazole ribonucleotide synthase
MTRIGIIGSGQLARMLAMAAVPMGCEVVCLSDQQEHPAAPVAKLLQGELTDPALIAAFLQQVDVVTVENENIDVALLNAIAEKKRLLPNAGALQLAQDRLLEKQLFSQLKIPTTAYQAVDHSQQIETFLAQHPQAILKTRRFGYDGKGQYKISDSALSESAWQAIGQQPAIVEAVVPFSCEVSCIAARNAQGTCQFYPLTENVHQAGILRYSFAPYRHAHLQAQAQAYVTQILNQLDYVGVLSVEFFVVGEQLIANEIAPRVHNSGHWTIEGAVTSQFANHIRAILDLPLGAAEARGESVMLNCIGHMPPREAVLAVDAHCFYHDYAKTPRVGRKLGHITMLATESLDRQSAALTQLKHLTKSTNADLVR